MKFSDFLKESQEQDSTKKEDEPTNESAEEDE